MTDRPQVAPDVARRLIQSLRPQWRVESLIWLPGGYSNTNYRIVTRDHGSFVLRIPSPGSDPQARRCEYQLLLWAAANNLAVAPEHFDVDTGVQLTRAIGSGALGDLPRTMWPEPEALGQTLAHLHSIPAPACDTPPLLQQLHAWQVHCDALGWPVPDTLAAQLGSWQPPAGGFDSVCHRDLNPWNVLPYPEVGPAGLVLLDWELAGIGDGRFDIANAVLLFEYGASDAQRCVAAASLGRLAVADLEPWMWLVRVREYLWARLALARGNRRPAIEAQHRERGAELGLPAATVQ